MAVTDVTKLLERLEAFEDRLGVRLESLSVFMEVIGDDCVGLLVRGELHPQAGTELQQDVELIVAAYDSSSRIVGTMSQHFEASGFFGFETFEMIVEIHLNEIARVRIYPKRSE
jgi:hypothetical protein